jgi:hypothetical protein
MGTPLGRSCLNVNGTQQAAIIRAVLRPEHKEDSTTSDQSGGTLPGGFPQTNPNEGVGNIQDSGALPGEPGSPTYNPNAALPPLNNPGGTGTSSGTSSGM